MSTSKIVVVLLAVLLAVNAKPQHKIPVHASSDPLPPLIAQLVRDMQGLMDTTADPCVDFYQYACGTFNKNNPIPANMSDTPYVNVPDIMNIEMSIVQWTAEVVTQPWPLVSEVYASCMQTPEQLAADLNQVYVGKVKMIETADASTPQARLDLVSGFFTFVFNAPFSVIKEQSGHTFFLGLEFFGNTYSNPTDYDVNTTSYDAFIKQASEAFEYFEGEPQAQDDAASVAAIEQTIALVSGPPENITLAQWNTKTNLNWTDFFGGLLTDREYFSAPTNISLVNYLLTEVTPTAFKRFLEFKVFQGLVAANVSQCFGISEAQAMNISLCAYIASNVPEYNQHYICSWLVYQMMPDYIGEIFAAQVVNDEVISDIHELTNDIHQGFANSLSNIDWLAANASNIQAVDFKLQNILQNIGHQSAPLNTYDGVILDRTSLLGNVFAITQESSYFSLAQWRVPFNRSNEVFDAQTVNAFYDPTQNTINFPAGILESPMYSATWPALWQYARLGYVVGHESIHGFDNTGSQFDAFGNQIDIFDQTTMLLYTEKAQCIVDLYDKFIAYGNVTMNGENTLGENIADIGGVKNSFRGYNLWVQRNGAEFVDGELIPGLSTNQIFFLVLGQTWCSVENEAYLEFQYEYDVHSPFKYRVNGPLSQFDQFSTAFNCPANTAMNPANKCDLW